MGNQLVSVIITTFKREFTILEKSIISVMEQSYKPVELIVVDDNDPESEYRRITAQSMREKYPDAIYIAHEKNSGAQKSRNDGILASHGKYIAFLDDDDLWLGEKLEKQIELFEKNENVGLVYAKGYMLRQEGTEYKRTPYNMSGCFISELNFDDMLYGDYIGTTTQAVISREAIAACGLFDLDQPTRQDYEMWIRISRRYRCLGAEEFLFEHYIHAGEQLTKNMVKSALGVRNIWRKYRYYYKRSAVARSHVFLQTANFYKLAKKYTYAGYYYFRSLTSYLCALINDRENLARRKKIHKTRLEAAKKNKEL